MTSTRRTMGLIGILNLFVLAVLASPAHGASATGGTGAAAAKKPAASAWQLVDYQQRTCFVSLRGGTSYYGIWISGTWTRQIDIGADGLPAGGSFYTSYAPIAPGSSDGIYSLAYVAVVLPAGAAVGTYTASLWASDGVTRNAVPITLVVQATSCRHY